MVAMRKRRDDEISDLQWLLLEIERIDCDHDAKRMVIGVIRNMAGCTLYLAKSVLVDPVKIATARSMLDVGATVSDVRDRLLAGGYCRSRNAAYRVITKALNQRGCDMAAAYAKKQPDMFGGTHANT